MPNPQPHRPGPSIHRLKTDDESDLQYVKTVILYFFTEIQCRNYDDTGGMHSNVNREILIMTYIAFASI